MALIGKDLEGLISEKGDGHRLDHLEGRLTFFPGDVKLILSRSVFPVDGEKESNVDAADDGSVGIERTRTLPTRGALRRFFQRCDFLMIFRGKLQRPLPRGRILQSASVSNKECG